MGDETTLMKLIDTDSNIPRVGRRALRDALAGTMARVHEGGVVEVTYENVREAVLLDSDLFDSMVAQVRVAIRMHEGLRLAMTAAAAGVRLPGALMDPFGLRVDEEALKRFRTAYPVQITHDDAGSPLASSPGFVESAAPILFVEDEDELVFVDE